MDYEVIILGAGPAGLFTAEKISSEKAGTKVLVIDKGKEITERKCPARTNGKACMQCNICNISLGVGGAGGLSDGKLNLDNRIGMDLKELQINKREANNKISYIDQAFVKYGADGNLSVPNSEEAKKLVERAKDKDATLLRIKQRHMGSDKTPRIISNFKEDLMQRGVEFLVKTEVENIEVENGFELETSKGTLSSKYLVAAPGRGGAYWFRDQAESLGLEYRFGEIDVGVRVEIDAEAYKEVTDLFYDPKFKMITRKYNDPVRTFCTNPQGEVTAELITDTKGENIILVNGHANKEHKTQNTNFAILYTINLTNPQGDTTEYGRNIAKFANFISGGKPLIQRYSDLRNHRRSTEKSISKNRVQPTLQGCNPGDLAMALPSRVMSNIMEALDTLEKILPGTVNESTLLYAPEIKFYDTKYSTTKNLETAIKNLYVAGDGVGKSRGIVGAALGGLLAAEGILKKLR
ncbi:MAG: NAD(P)/FAD-dependent oxidoreductase [archaeon]